MLRLQGWPVERPWARTASQVSNNVSMHACTRAPLRNSAAEGGDRTGGTGKFCGGCENGRGSMPCPSDLHGRRQAERRGRREVESGVHCAKMGYFYAARAVWLGLFGEKPTPPAGERPESWESDPTRGADSRSDCLANNGPPVSGMPLRVTHGANCEAASADRVRRSYYRASWPRSRSSPS